MPMPANTPSQQINVMSLQGQPQQQSQPPMVQIPAPQMLDLSVLETTQGDERRNLVGNAVYPVIQRVFGDQYAAKITGMVIDETAVDVKRLFHDQSYFQ